MLDIKVDGQLVTISHITDKKEVCKFRDYLFGYLQTDGLMLDCIGFKINGYGSNNPLIAASGCLTPTYNLLYQLSNMRFTIKDTEGYEDLQDRLLPIELEVNNSSVSINDLKEACNNSGIIMDYSLDEVNFIQTIKPEVKLEFLFYLVHDSYDINELKYYHKRELNQYYLALNSRSITYKTIFNEDNIQFLFSPSIVNFKEIYARVISEYEEISKF